jgi:hypothetical protein
MKKEQNIQEPQHPALRVGAVSFELFQELYGQYIQLNDRFESVHIWSEELALKNAGRWTPIKISQAKYKAEMLHSWNNCS